ncbi:CoA transferase [Ammonicoccus fulvus]|uniref:CoA transferase n=1 Tax=Ammonicoccus fulvus TaxID=3138240 RepID=A0ABZ3FJ85_9ACTN
MTDTQETTAPKLPLAGVRVVEMSTSVAGPTAGMILGALGAEVIKVERVGVGDDTRSWVPPYWNGVSAFFLNLNASKKSIELDFKDPRGLDLLKKLIAESDVLMQNLRAGALAKAGLDWETLKEINPKLIYCEMTGFGTAGPKAMEPAYDPLVQAYAGIVNMMPEFDGAPARVPLSINDKGTAMWGVISILGALIQRDATGEAQKVNVSLLQTAVDWVSGGIVTSLAGNPPSPKLGSGFPGVVPYGAFPAADGFIFISAGNQGLWEQVCHCLDAPELIEREGFGSNPERASNRQVVNHALGEVTSRFTRAELVQRLTAAKVPHSSVQAVRELPEDPQVKAMELLQAVPHPEVPELQLPRVPIDINGRHLDHYAAPLLGADSFAIAHDLGFTTEEIDAMAEDKVLARTGLSENVVGGERGA